MLSIASAILFSSFVHTIPHLDIPKFELTTSHGYDTVFQVNDHIVKVQYFEYADYMFPKISGHPDETAQNELNAEFRDFVLYHYDDWVAIDWEAVEKERSQAEEFEEPFFPPQQTVATVSIDFMDHQFLMITKNAEDEYDLSMCDNVEYLSYNSQTLTPIDICEKLFIKSKEAWVFVETLLDETYPIVNDEDDPMAGFDSAVDSYYLTADGLVGVRTFTTWYTCDGGVDCAEETLAFDMEELYERFGKK